MAARRRTRTRDEYLASLRYGRKDALEALGNAIAMGAWANARKYLGQLETFDRKIVDATMPMGPRRAERERRSRPQTTAEYERLEEQRRRGRSGVPNGRGRDEAKPPRGTYLGPEIWGPSSKNEELRRKAFLWLSRIGAAPSAKGRPIGWYQQHQVTAIEELEKGAELATGHRDAVWFRSQPGGSGYIQVYDPRRAKWLPAGFTASKLYDLVDRKIRR